MKSRLPIQYPEIIRHHSIEGCRTRRFSGVCKGTLGPAARYYPTWLRHAPVFSDGGFRACVIAKKNQQTRSRDMGVEVGGIVGLIILIADIWAILNVIQSGASTGGKVLWILLILVLPIVGLLIWLVAGPRNRGVA
jgi:hypothetical protein